MWQLLLIYGICFKCFSILNWYGLQIYIMSWLWAYTSLSRWGAILLAVIRNIFSKSQGNVYFLYALFKSFYSFLYTSIYIDIKKASVYGEVDFIYWMRKK